MWPAEVCGHAGRECMRPTYQCPAVAAPVRLPRGRAGLRPPVLPPAPGTGKIDGAGTMVPDVLKEAVAVADGRARDEYERRLERAAELRAFGTPQGAGAEDQETRETRRKID